MNPQLQQMLQQAIQSFHCGNFDRASSILKRVIQSDSKSVSALHILAIVSAIQSKHKEAIDLLRDAIKIAPKDPSLYYDLAKVLQESGADYESLPYHKKAITLSPNNIDALLNYGVSLTRLGSHQDALDIFIKILSINPSFLEALLNANSTLNELQRHEEALIFIDKALEIDPGFVEAWTNKGITLNDLQRYDEALVHYDKALDLKPDYYEAWYNKGVTLHELQRHDEALVHYDKAINLKPDYHEAWSNKGATLYEMRHFDEALVHYDKAINLKPDYHQALLNRGMALNECRRFDEALAHFDKALEIDPSLVKAWASKGVTLNELQRLDEAIIHFDKALSFKSDINWVYGYFIHAKMKISSWKNIQEDIRSIADKVLSNLKIIQPFVLLSLADDASLHKRCSEIYSQDRYPVNLILGPISKRLKSEKIRLAYFSPDFRNHPVSFLTSELFELHDRAQFEVYAFSLEGAPDGDETRLRLKKAFDIFIDAEDMSDLDIARLARELEIDIAIDLAGHTKSARTGIFSYRAAPIQINWLGYPGTLGVEFIDYILADKIIIPESNRQFYSEKVVCLSHTYMVDDSKRIASSRLFTKKECGLPENAFVFCCFNNNYKFNAKVLDSWSRILLNAKNSVLWISENNEKFKVNITAEFEVRGINASRVIFATRLESMADHLSRYAIADLFLDTHPYNAHTTAVDSLKMGIPIITLIGNSFASRVAASLLNAIDLPELIATTQEEYEALAIELATNHQKFTSIKQKLANNRSSTSLFNTPLFAKDLEMAYVVMINRYLVDLQPDHIDV